MIVAVVVLCLIGLLLIVMREEVTLLQKMAFGARLHVGCAVAEGVAVIVFALAVAILYSRGWLD